MCLNNNVCLRNICICFFAIMGLILMITGLCVETDKYMNETIADVLFILGVVFVIISICISKCCRVIVVTVDGEYEYRVF